ncbi:MAG: SpoIIE family protein phosphatase [Planctomycetota bacterium]|jgi:serine/threonine protein phosphatase PrpC
MNSPFIEVDFARRSKAGQGAPGDVFISNRLANEGRIVCVLADGLGSGIKANVLATLTATMAMKYICSEMDIRQAAEVIMETLPVCSQRKIGYSTFTIVDIRNDGTIRVVEHDNPPYVLLRGSKQTPVEKTKLEINTTHLGRRELSYSCFEAQKGSRLVVYSDGVSQSGMGSMKMPLGWTDEHAATFITDRVQRLPEISARQLSKETVTKALGNDRYAAKDDISCAVINFRKPRKLLVLTGPPIDPARDKMLAEQIANFDGRTAICGGTTANIVARELGRSVQVNLSLFDPAVPPASTIKGVDLVTEGTLTMSKAADILEKGDDPEQMQSNAAVKLVDALLQSDIIEFVVGTKINQAHQDPNLPVGLDIRQNLLRRITGLLNSKYMKETRLNFI